VTEVTKRASRVPVTGRSAYVRELETIGVVVKEKRGLGRGRGVVMTVSVPSELVSIVSKSLANAEETPSPPTIDVTTIRPLSQDTSLDLSPSCKAYNDITSPGEGAGGLYLELAVAHQPQGRLGSHEEELASLYKTREEYAHRM